MPEEKAVSEGIGVGVDVEDSRIELKERLATGKRPKRAPITTGMTDGEAQNH